MSSSFRTKAVYYVSLIAIVACLGIWTPAVTHAQPADAALDDSTPTNSLPEPSTAILAGLGIAGIAVVRWLRKR